MTACHIQGVRQFIFVETKIPVPRHDILYFNNNIPEVTEIRNS